MPELIEPVIAAFCALIVVVWLPAALLIAAEFVKVPLALIAIEPEAVVAVRLAEVVTSPPYTVIGPAIEVATGMVIAALLVELPMVSDDEVDEMVTPASETAAPNAVAPVGGSIVLVPVPARLTTVGVGLFA